MGADPDLGLAFFRALKIERDLDLASGPEDGADVLQEIRLDVRIAAETVGPIVKLLGEAKKGDRILLYMRSNGGGDVDRLFELIKALFVTEADVTITFGRYAMSAAATLWLWFFLRPTPNVKAVPPRKPAVLMYHRPRSAVGDTGRYCFAEDFPAGDVRRVLLEQKVRIFDSLFEAAMDALGWDKSKASPEVYQGVKFRHGLDYLREAYYGNKDCLIPVKEEEAGGTS